MAVAIDNPAEIDGTAWCHLVADSPVELRAAARRLGLRPEWIQGGAKHPHFDLKGGPLRLAQHLWPTVDRATMLAMVYRCAARMAETSPPSSPPNPV